MSAEQSWGEDTVAFGRPGEATAPEPGPRRRPPRGPRRRWPRPANGTVALAVVGIGALVALIAILGQGSGSSTAPIREAHDRAPRVARKLSLPSRRAGRHPDSKPALKRRPKGQLEGGRREPHKASPTTHEQAPAEPEPAPVVESEPEPAPIAEAQPEPVTEPAPEPPEPTPPAVEFGL